MKICTVFVYSRHVKIGNSASNGVCINRREPPKLSCTWAPLSCGGNMAGPIEIHPSPRVIVPYLVILGHRIRALLKRSAKNLLTNCDEIFFGEAGGVTSTS